MRGKLDPITIILFGLTYILFNPSITINVLGKYGLINEDIGEFTYKILTILIFGFLYILILYYYLNHCNGSTFIVIFILIVVLIIKAINISVNRLFK